MTSVKSKGEKRTQLSQKRQRVLYAKIMADFKMHEAEEVLDFIESCDVVRADQLSKLYPNYNISKITKYLVGRKRIHMSSDGQFINSTQVGTTDEPRPDKALIATLGVLGDLMSKVRQHTKAPPPAQISFLSHNGELFEIVYVGYGLEAMVSNMFNRSQPTSSEEVKRIIVIEDTSQAAKVKAKIPNIMRFALVLPSGGYEYINPDSVGLS